MGHRAKNKQAAPAPLAEKNNRDKPAPKKLGKRKQSPEPENRPAKKVKAKQSSKALGKTKAEKPKSKPKKEADGEEAEESGWEDVEDDEDLKTERKCVAFTFSMYSLLNISAERCSMTVAMNKSVL